MRGIIINGSPKGESSNSLRLADAFARGMGMAKIPVYHITRMNLQPCKGCFGCWRATPGRCVIRDDMDILLEEMKAADYIIWSFPLYYYSVPGILKNVIDRQLPLLSPFMEESKSGGSGAHASRYDRSHQKHVLISTCGFYSPQNNYQAVYHMFDHMLGRHNYTDIFCGQGELFSVLQLAFRTDAYLQLVEQAGREYRAGQITAATEEQLKELLFPKDVFEEMADASWGIAAESGHPDTEKAPKGRNFTRQMAALYNPSSYDGKDRVLEFYYTDLEETYQIRLGREGHRLTDRDFVPYTTRIETPFTVWQEISEGKISGTKALAMHQYRVLGDFDLMIHWDLFFYGGTSGNEADGQNNSAGKTASMKILLGPWIFVWLALSFQPYYLGIAGVICIAMLPFAWMKYEAIVYEYVSVLAGAAFCLMALIGVSEEIWLPVSYLMFGLMWTLSTLFPVPLTAYYSCHGYGGRTAFGNELFITTNRILTGCWGIMYLLTAIWTWFVLRSSYAGSCIWINQILPVAMGLFTVWFQKWYPAKIAANG
ncbi:MAG: NAD(P)H-dependent oxidoreductase [Lachnospiraceae bacterium]